jgi:predicted DNA-binding transcriptional regulator AlpA
MDARDLLSQENQQVLLFTLAGDESDHPPERVAAYLGGSIGTLSNWRNFGTGPKFRKVGGKVMYRKADVIAWVDSNPAVQSLTELSQIQAESSRHAA